MPGHIAAVHYVGYYFGYYIDLAKVDINSEYMVSKDTLYGIIPRVIITCLIPAVYIERVIYWSVVSEVCELPLGFANEM